MLSHERRMTSGGAITASVRGSAEIVTMRSLPLFDDRVAPATGRDPEAAHAIRAYLLQRLHPMAHAVSVCVIVHVDAGPNVTTVARLLGVGPRTLERRFADAGLDRPLHLIALVRWLCAACALVEPGVTVSAVAARMGFSSDRAMRLALRRHLGVSPGALRTVESMETLATTIVAAYGPRTSPTSVEHRLPRRMWPRHEIVTP